MTELGHVTVEWVDNGLFGQSFVEFGWLSIGIGLIRVGKDGANMGRAMIKCGL